MTKMNRVLSVGGIFLGLAILVSELAPRPCLADGITSTTFDYTGPSIGVNYSNDWEAALDFSIGTGTAQITGYFTVDGTLIQAWAHRRSFHPKDPPTVVGTGARGRKLLRDTHASKTDPEARLYSKGGPALPSYLGHVITENRNGLVVAACATQSSRTAEAEAALRMLDEMGHGATAPVAVSRALAKITVGADSAYQLEFFIDGLRARGIHRDVLR